MPRRGKLSWLTKAETGHVQGRHRADWDLVYRFEPG